MKQYAIKLIAISIVFVLWLCVLAVGQRGRYDFNDAFQNINGVATVKGFGTGGLTDYDLCVGDTTTPNYGMVQFGNAVLGRTSYNVSNMDLDGSVVLRNMGVPSNSKIQFAFLESGGQAIRFALATSGAGNATYNPRSLLIAGPAVLNDEIVTVGYWQTNNSIFSNLACDTSGDGADLGVQNDFEVMGDIFATGLSAYADNAAAVTGGLAVGQFYRTGGDPDLVCIVH